MNSNGAVKFCDFAEDWVRKLVHKDNLSNKLLNASGGGGKFNKIFCYIIKQVPKNDGTGCMILKMEENPEHRI